MNLKTIDTAFVLQYHSRVINSLKSESITLSTNMWSIIPINFDERKNMKLHKIVSNHAKFYHSRPKVGCYPHESDMNRHPYLLKVLP